ncbi:olfactory receptor 10J1-like [Misgurnus anguillicaudatus]|uniref:olfactory receptor 10J1-like n=1 Tax=Misgurnus anguillicaudatus TaxID=75329 RepID=UPI002435AD84|nr:olfactory receptor 10J1-like [Misgurnus anguillicaudatus]
MNQTSGFDIVFSSYEFLRPQKHVLAVFIFLLYAAATLANIFILFVIYVESSLHKPMYIFLFNLICCGLMGSSAVWPKVLSNLLTDWHVSSYEGCLVQVYLLSVYAACTYTTLTLMAYDRYVSICKPLQYHVIMKPSKLRLWLILGNLVPALSIAGQIYLTSRIPLCSRTLNKLFCDNLSIINISCVTGRIGLLSNVYGLLIIVCLSLFPTCLILLSYVKILSVSLRVSKVGQKKALGTCIPHLIVFINYSIATVFSVIYNRFNVPRPSEMNVFISVQITLFPPLLHPVIYGVRTKEIRKCTAKITRSLCKSVSSYYTSKLKVAKIFSIS